MLCILSSCKLSNKAVYSHNGQEHTRVQVQIVHTNMLTWCNTLLITLNITNSNYDLSQATPSSYCGRI